MTRLCEIREAALSLDEVVSAVQRPEAGGIAVFIGTVRDHNDGKPVTELEYSAYESMAHKEMQAILDELERELPGVQLAVLHRVGRLALGDAAVVCAASAAHREQAFAVGEWWVQGRQRCRLPAAAPGPCRPRPSGDDRSA